MPGRSVSHYELTEELGRGGSGIVYKARDTRLGRTVALKFLSPHLLSSQEAVARFLYEAQAISVLSHPNIAVLYDVGEEEGARFLVLEYLPGGTLRTRVRDLQQAGLRLSLEEITRYALQVSAGLAYAHRHGVIHRDVKSGNVMFSEEGAAKITDFGLAKWWRDSELTSPGVILGTAAYMSPEQAQGREADSRSDVFSLGVVLYEMAAGELPFRGPHEAAVLREVIETPTPSLAGVRPELPEGFGEIVARATAKCPEERYQSVEELADDLRVLCPAPESAGVSWRGDEVTLPATARRSQPSWAVRRRAGILGAAAVLLATLLAVVFRGPLGEWLAVGRLPPQKQLAVLLFNNVGNDPANQPFCDGLMETLAAKFSQLEQFHGSLCVVPASEVRREKLTSAADARRAFGVNLVLTGSVQRFGDTVRLTITLVDAVTLRGLRSDIRDTPVGNLTVLQDGVFSRAAAMLELELQPNVRAALSAGHTRVPAAYHSYVQALGCLSRYDVVENIDRAIALFRQAVDQDPEYALAHAGLGEAYWWKFQRTKEQKWAEDARASCLRAVECDSRLAGVHVTLGLVYRETGQSDKAIEELRAALDIDPMSADGHRQLARTYEVMGKTEEAEATHNRAIQLRPHFWMGYWDLGEFYFRRAHYDKAAEQYRQVIQLVPDHARAHASLGGIYYLQGRYGEAADMFKKSLAISPTPEAYSNLGSLYTMQRRYAEAVPMYEKAIEMGTAKETIWGNLAEAYRQVPGLVAKAPGAYARAIELGRQQLAVNPKEGRVRARLALYLARLGRKQEAVEEIEQARRLAPDNQNVLFRSVVIYELTGHRDRALKALATAAASGYSLSQIQGMIDLAELRKDPRYRELVEGRTRR